MWPDVLVIHTHQVQFKAESVSLSPWIWAERMSCWDPQDEWRRCCEVSLKKKKKFIYLLIFGHAGSLLLCGLLSNCSEWGLLSSCGVPPSLLWYLLLLWSTGSRPAGFSTCDSQALEATTGSAVVVHGVSCSVAGGIFPDLESNPCLVHWQVNSLPLNHQGSLDVVGLLGWSLQRSCSLHCPYGLYMHETRLSWLWNKAGCHGDSEDQALHVVWS